MRSFDRPTRLRLEVLEDRCVPASLFWTGFFSSDWNTGANWSQGYAPGAGDDAVIVQYALRSPTISSGDHSVRSLSGSGSLTLAGGSLRVAESSSFGQVTVEDGVLDFMKSSVLQRLTLKGGTLEGGGTVGVTVALSISGSDDKTLDDVDLVSFGTAAWSGGRVNALRGATFANKGTWISTATDCFDPAFSNSGTASFASSGIEQFGTMANSGTVKLLSGTLQASSYSQSGGATQLGGRTLDADVSLSGGYLTGGGTIGGDLVNTGGTIEPGGGKTLAVSGDFTQGSGGTLVLDVDTGGTDDKLSVTGSATLGGKLSVNVAGTTAGTTKVISMTSRAGTFGTVAFTKPASTTTSVIYASKSVSVVVAQVPVLAPSAPPQPPASVPVVPIDNGTKTKTTGTTDAKPADAKPEEKSGEQLVGKAAQPVGVGVMLSPSSASVSPVGAAALPPLAPVAELPALGGKAITARGAGSEGASSELVDVLMALAMPELPELSFAEDDHGLAHAGAGLLVGKMKPVLSRQRGSSVAAVATVRETAEEWTRREARADLAFAALIHPEGEVGGWADRETKPDKSYVAADEEAAEPVPLGGLAMGAFGLLGGAAALVGWAARRKGDRKLRRM